MSGKDDSRAEIEAEGLRSQGFRMTHSSESGMELKKDRGSYFVSASYSSSTGDWRASVHEKTYDSGSRKSYETGSYKSADDAVRDADRNS